MESSSLFTLIFFFITYSYTCTSAAIYRGYWEKTWRVSSTRFSSANLGIAFSGHSHTSTAISDSRKVYNRLQGHKIITIGGGNIYGRWTAHTLRSLRRSIQTGALNRYSGIAFNIEEGDAGLTREFLKTFSTAKRARFFVIVTITKTAPYGFYPNKEAQYLTWKLIRSRNVNILSPMMYGSSSEGDYNKCSQNGGLDTRSIKGVPWEWFKYSRAAVVPSLWKYRYYSQAKAFLRSKGIRTKGYILWCL